MKPHHNIGYVLIQDDSSHWYLIQATDREDFERWSKDTYRETELDLDFSNCEIAGPHTIVIYQYEEV